MKIAAKDIGVAVRWGAAWHINNIAEYDGSMENARRISAELIGDSYIPELFINSAARTRAVTIPQMAKAGFALNLLGVVLITLFIFVALPLVLDIDIRHLPAALLSK